MEGPSLYVSVFVSQCQLVFLTLWDNSLCGCVFVCAVKTLTQQFLSSERLSEVSKETETFVCCEFSQTLSSSSEQKPNAG